MISMHAMCRLTCSRCWCRLLWQYQHAHNPHFSEIFVQVLGDGRYIDAAQQLIETLSLPIRFIPANNPTPVWHLNIENRW